MPLAAEALEPQVIQGMGILTHIWAHMWGSISKLYGIKTYLMSGSVAGLDHPVRTWQGVSIEEAGVGRGGGKERARAWGRAYPWAHSASGLGAPSGIRHSLSQNREKEFREEKKVLRIGDEREKLPVFHRQWRRRWGTSSYSSHCCEETVCSLGLVKGLEHLISSENMPVHCWPTYQHLFGPLTLGPNTGMSGSQVAQMWSPEHGLHMAYERAERLLELWS